MNKLIRGDEVIVISGKDKGKTGVIDKVMSDTFIIKGVNLSKKHQKPNPNKGVAGGIVQIELPIHKSNIAIYNKSKKTKDIIELTRRNIRNSNALINAYDKKISLYNKQLVNLENAIIRNNQSINDIKKSYETRSISLYKNRNNDLSNYIFNSKSFSQMIYRLKYFNIISEINQKSVNKIKTTQKFNRQKTS